MVLGPHAAHLVVVQELLYDGDVLRYLLLALC